MVARKLANLMAKGKHWEKETWRQISDPLNHYGFHRLQILFENGHQEGTTEARTRDRNHPIATGLRCIDCGLAVSWKSWRTLRITLPNGVSLEQPLPMCRGDPMPMPWLEKESDAVLPR